MSKLVTLGVRLKIQHEDFISMFKSWDFFRVLEKVSASFRNFWTELQFQKLVGQFQNFRKEFRTDSGLISEFQKVQGLVSAVSETFGQIQQFRNFRG